MNGEYNKEANLTDEELMYMTGGAAFTQVITDAKRFLPKYGIKPLYGIVVFPLYGIVPVSLENK